MRGYCCTIICSLFLLSSCNYKKIKDIDVYNAQTGGGNQKPIDVDLKLGFATIKEYAMNTCFNCHVGKNEPELGTIELVRQNIQAILDEMRTNSMPPTKEGYSFLSDCQKALIEEWVKFDLVENSDVKVMDINGCRGLSSDKDKKTEMPMEQMPVTYATLLERILKPRCISCHNTQNETEAADTLFFPYDEIANDRFNWKTPGANSKIVRLLRRNDDDRMPPPEDGVPLTESEIRFVIQWIEAGKPK